MYLAMSAFVFWKMRRRLSCNKRKRKIQNTAEQLQSIRTAPAGNHRGCQYEPFLSPDFECAPRALAADPDWPLHRKECRRALRRERRRGADRERADLLRATLVILSRNASTAPHSLES